MIYIYLLCKHQLYIICSFRYSELCGLTLQKFVLIETVFYVTRRVFLYKPGFQAAWERHRGRERPAHHYLNHCRFPWFTKTNLSIKTAETPTFSRPDVTRLPMTPNTHTHTKKKAPPKKYSCLCVFILLLTRRKKEQWLTYSMRTKRKQEREKQSNTEL